MKTQASNIDGKSTLVALAFVTICTIVGAYNTFSTEPSVHESPIFDVIKSVLFFCIVSLLAAAFLVEILIRLQALFSALIIVIFLVLAMVAFPLMWALLPILGPLVAIFLVVVFFGSFSEFSKDAERENAPFISKTMNKVFYLLIFVSICSGMILYDDFTKPEGGAFRKSIHFKTVGTIPVSKQKF